MITLPIFFWSLKYGNPFFNNSLSRKFSKLHPLFVVNIILLYKLLLTEKFLENAADEVLSYSRSLQLY